MSRRRIKVHPHDDKVLRRKCLKVKKIDRSIKLLIEDMMDTMEADEGVGLAAVQVGVLKRIIVCKIENAKRAFINPKILKTSGSQVSFEGCLSIPGIFGELERAEAISVKAQDLSGGVIKMDAEGFLARVFQHEIDHLNGVLFIDKARTLKTIKEEDMQDVI